MTRCRRIVPSLFQISQSGNALPFSASSDWLWPPRRAAKRTKFANPLLLLGISTLCRFYKYFLQNSLRDVYWDIAKPDFGSTVLDAKPIRNHECYMNPASSTHTNAQNNPILIVIGILNSFLFKCLRIYRLVENIQQSHNEAYCSTQNIKNNNTDNFK